MDTLNVRSENDRHKQIKALTDRTLLSLLRTFDPESLLFDSSVQAAETTKPTERDSAVVLVAIELAKEGMRRDKPLDGRVESTDGDRGKTFVADLDKYRKKLDEGKPEPIVACTRHWPCGGRCYFACAPSWPSHRTLPPASTQYPCTRTSHPLYPVRRS